MFWLHEAGSAWCDRQLLNLQLCRCPLLYECTQAISPGSGWSASSSSCDEAREAGSSDGPEDVIPPYTAAATVSRAGDLWLLGAHRLLCGDAREQTAYEALLAGDKAQFVFTDPPYNVPIDGHVCGLGRIRHGDFAMGCGEMSETEFTTFLATVFTRLAANTIDGSIHQVCMDWRHIPEMLAAGREVYTELKNLCVWNKTNAGMGTFYRSKHELVFIWKSGNAPHINTFELGQHGRSRSNVWDYAGANVPKAGRLEELAMHPTVKPVALVADAIKDCSRRNGFDSRPFCRQRHGVDCRRTHWPQSPRTRN